MWLSTRRALVDGLVREHSSVDGGGAGVVAVWWTTCPAYPDTWRGRVRLVRSAGGRRSRAATWQRGGELHTASHTVLASRDRPASKSLGRGPVLPPELLRVCMPPRACSWWWWSLSASAELAVAEAEWALPSVADVSSLSLCQTSRRVCSAAAGSVARMGGGAVRQAPVVEGPLGGCGVAAHALSAAAASCVGGWWRHGWRAF
jgi:hypothetical protein